MAELQPIGMSLKRKTATISIIVDEDVAKFLTGYWHPCFKELSEDDILYTFENFLVLNVSKISTKKNLRIYRLAEDFIRIFNIERSITYQVN
jgi:hypothetical protein